MGSVQELKLLGEKLGPYVSRVMMSLSLKGINYEFFPEDLQNKSELLLKSNPVYKKCPVLIHNGKPICESLVILEYIEETWPGSPHPLLPSDPFDRAVARFWADFIDKKLGHSMMEIIKTSDKEARAKWAEEAKASAAFLEDALKSLGKGKTYFGGEKPGLVDLVFGSFYGNLKAIETLREVSLINGEATPALNALLEALQGNEGVKDLVPDQVRVTEIFRNFIHSQHQA